MTGNATILVQPEVGMPTGSQERERIVKFLRLAANDSRRNGFHDRASSLDWEIDRIENGDHLR